MREQAAQQHWWTRLADRSEQFAIRLSERPYAAMAGVLALNASLAGLFILAGDLIFDDPAEFFRELQPGTWLSFLELLFVASIASTIYRLGGGSGRAGLGDFWGLSAAIFALFAFLEITQLTQFLSKGLNSLEASAPFGFRDIDAFVLSILFVVAAVWLLRHVGELFAHPPAMAVLAVGVLLGAASQTLDSALKSTSNEFVVEECFKLAAEVFLIGGYLLVLNRVRRIGASPQELV